MFAWQDAGAAADLQLPGPHARARSASARGTAKFDLDAGHWLTRRAAWSAASSYTTDLFDGATIDRMRLSAGRCCAPWSPTRAAGRRARRCSTAAERQQLLETGTRTAAPYPHDACIHELFEAQAARTPDAVAAGVRATTTLTYAELDARANRLAHHLRPWASARTAGRRSACERSPEMVVGLLGSSRPAAPTCRSIPTYPAERLAFMLADAGAPCC